MSPDDIAEMLRQAIREGVFNPGDELVQESLASQLGVSRIPLREALRILSGEGLVMLEQGRGASVTELHVSEVEELYDLRLLIEPRLARRIIANCSPSDRAHLQRFVDDMATQVESDPTGWSESNYEFHQEMYRLADRPQTLRIVTQLLNLVEPYSRIYVYLLASTDRVQVEHHDMMEAIDSQDVDKLGETIRLHLDGARESLIAAMNESADDGADTIRQLLRNGEQRT